MQKTCELATVDIVSIFSQCANHVDFFERPLDRAVRGRNLCEAVTMLSCCRGQIDRGLGALS